MESIKTKYLIKCGVSLLVLSNLLVCITEASEEYEIPQPKFKLLKPKGFQVSIPDENGIRLFAFHGNLNKKMQNMSSGQFAMDVIDKMNGKWIYQNPKLKIRSGDVIYFWVFVMKNGRGYTREDGIYEVTESDFNRASKKSHKLKKRFVHQQIDSAVTYGSRFNRHQYGVDDSDEKPFGHNYGHGLPHHHRRGYHNQGPGRYIEHTPEYHGTHLFSSLHRPHETLDHGYRNHYNDHTFHGHDHGHGHRGGFNGHPHHSWDHNHGHDCNWPDSSDESSSNNDDTIAESTPSTTNTVAGIVIPVTVKQSITTELPTPEPEAEMIVTTTSEPQIDLRFGGKTR